MGILTLVGKTVAEAMLKGNSKEQTFALHFGYLRILASRSSSAAQKFRRIIVLENHRLGKDVRKYGRLDAK